MMIHVVVALLSSKPPFAINQSYKPISTVRLIIATVALMHLATGASPVRPLSAHDHIDRKVVSVQYPSILCGSETIYSRAPMILQLHVNKRDSSVSLSDLPSCPFMQKVCFLQAGVTISF